jgi:hypothetical protein
MFRKIFKKKQNPVSYQIEHPSEVVELFSRLTLHHQVALLRLMSRNLMVNVNGKTTMGYEMNFDVNGALIEATTDEPTGESLDQPSNT